MTTPANLIVFVAESHNRQALGRLGRLPAQTPVLDRLTARGVAFPNAYCSSPICVPSRASIATGRYAHQTRYWENSLPYDGAVESWMKRLREAGHEVTGIGKLHFRGVEDDNGFSEEIATMHVAEGIGELIGLLRSSGEEPVRGLWDLYTRRTGIGETTAYQEYDRKITKLAIDWLGKHRAKPAKPWVLCIHYVSAHAPYTVPQELFDLYPLERMPLPPQWRPGERPTHPAVAHLRRILGQSAELDEAMLRKIAACYFAVITHLDRQVGEVMAALDGFGLAGDTRVIYTADHGYSWGNHFLLGLFNLYEDGVGVPLLMAGPGIPAGRAVEQIVSHVDLFPTILEAMGMPPAAADRDLPGVSLWPAMAGRESPRLGFAEYHAIGSKAGAFMLREGNDKLIYHVGMAPQLFDLAADPDEVRDLVAAGSGHARASELEMKLRRIVDPEAVDRLAKDDQRRRVEALGGKEEVLRLRSGFVYSPPPGADWRKI